MGAFRRRAGAAALRDEEVTHARQHFGGRSVDYRHYLAELARKPQTVRQVAPELVAALLESERGGHEAARALARLLR